jgi:Cu2+-exporting ATPase
VFSRDHVELIRFHPEEALGADVEQEIAALQKRGYEVFLLSGDRQARVDKLANRLNLPPCHAHGEQDPRQKEDWLRAHDRGTTLFIGDGINDSLAAKAATCSGTPALDRPFMASHCDFYLGSSRIAPIRNALASARKLTKVIRRNLVFAVVYNLLAISLAWAGLMQPWLAAILMPASSILIVLATVASLSSNQKERLAL